MPEEERSQAAPEVRARATDLVRMARDPGFSDEEQAGFEDELKRLIPHPAWVDLMFWHDPDLTDEEVVEEALRYRPIEL